MCDWCCLRPPKFVNFSFGKVHGTLLRHFTATDIQRPLLRKRFVTESIIILNFTLSFTKCSIFTLICSSIITLSVFKGSPKVLQSCESKIICPGKQMLLHSLIIINIATPVITRISKTGYHANKNIVLKVQSYDL